MNSRRVSKLQVWPWIIVTLLLSGATELVAQTGNDDADVEMSNISGDIDNPRRHFRLRHPKKLASEEANKIYEIVKPALSSGYSASSGSLFDGYQAWRRYNTAPYLSSTHGNHYLNNYANDVARNYGKFENAGVLPEGSILVKDSFSVTQSRQIVLGPLFVMQKMSEGFNLVSGNWKYLQIQPDGTLLGETNGVGSQRVDYCVPCHLARESFDHLYFIPREDRIN